MKSVIIYTTTHGCTEKCVVKLQQQLGGNAKLVNIKKSKLDNLEYYETIIIGGSIHAGQIQRRIKKFCQTNLDTLKKKKIGIFLCCMEEGETAQKQFQDAFPDELIEHATATGIFGGEFNFEKMNFVAKAIIKKIAKVDKNVSKIDEKSIIDFAKKMKE